MAETPHRPRLIPQTTIIAAAVIVVLIAGAIGASFLVSRSRLLEVPDVVGLPAVAAEATVLEAGLSFRTLGTRVSLDVPAGSVISQDPPPGTTLRPGDPVGVFVSAGRQTFVVPDLIGSPVEGAREVLSALGFEVVIQMRPSDTTAAVVIEMFPAPGTAVSAGDTIRLTVPGEAADGDTLLPYDISGTSILLDPTVVDASVTSDAPMEVARRLRALLEAAGATVTSTRPASGTAPTAEERAEAVRTSTADLFVGIDIGSSGAPGLYVLHLPEGAADAPRALSERYARSITRAATLPTLVVNEPQPSDDAILATFPGAGVRIMLGDAGVEADRARFTDPAWADQVARSIYRGIGTVLAAE
jgi:hypothetical protein